MFSIARPADTWRFNCQLSPKAPPESMALKTSRYDLIRTCFPKREGVYELGCLPEPSGAWGLGVQVAGHVGECDGKESPFDSVFLFHQNEPRGSSLEQ